MKWQRSKLNFPHLTSLKWPPAKPIGGKEEIDSLNPCQKNYSDIFWWVLIWENWYDRVPDMSHTSLRISSAAEGNSQWPSKGNTRSITINNKVKSWNFWLFFLISYIYIIYLKREINNNVHSSYIYIFIIHLLLVYPANLRSQPSEEALKLNLVSKREQLMELMGTCVVPHYKYCFISNNTTITSILFSAIIAF